MKFNLQTYKIAKTRNYLKTSTLLFFLNGVNQNSESRIKTEQKLKRLNVSYYKTFNKTSQKVFNRSIYTEVSGIINAVTFFMTPYFNKKLSSMRKLTSDNLFFPLALKLNTKVYSKPQIEHLLVLEYSEHKTLLCQFLITYNKIEFFETM